MKHAIWTPVAESDLDDLLYYVAVVDGRPSTAERVLHEIRDAVSAQANSVFPGHKHPLAPSGWRYIKHKRWLIFFKQQAETIEIMRVIDAVRDLPRQIEE